MALSGFGMGGSLGGVMYRALVRFPDPLVEVGRENECPESGEFFFHGRLRQKFSLKVDNSAQNWLSPHVISHFLIDQPRTSALGAAVELLFCLPPVWESSATNLGFSLNCISQLDFFHICFIFVFIRFSVFHQFGKVLQPIWDFHSNVFLSWISFIFVFIRSGCLTI